MNLTKHQKKILTDMALKKNVTVIYDLIFMRGRLAEDDTHTTIHRIRNKAFKKFKSHDLIRISWVRGGGIVYYKPTQKAIDLVKNNFKEG